MQGNFFVHAGPDPRNPQRMLVKSGIVKSQIGENMWLLEFQAQGYRFSNVLAADKLTNFAFFETEEERKAFMADLMASAGPTEPPRSEAQTPPADSAIFDRPPGC